MLTAKFKFVKSAASVNKMITRYVAGRKAAVKEDLAMAGKSWDEIPGPPSLPIIGQLHNFLPGGLLYNLSSNEVMEKLRATYGPIIKLQFSIAKPPAIMLFDAESCAKVLRGEDSLPIRISTPSLEYYRKNYKKQIRNGEVTGFATDAGETWKRLRSAANPMLLPTKTMKLYSPDLDLAVHDFISRLKILRRDENKLKNCFDWELSLLTLEMVGVVTLGYRIGCLDSDLPQDSPSNKLITSVAEFFKLMNKLDNQPSLWRYYATSNFKKAMKICEEIENLIKKLIEKAIEKSINKENSDKPRSIFHKLLDIDEDFATITATDILWAGLESSVHTMIYTMYLLAINPDKQEKLREEIMMENGSKKYLKACIKESLRVLPVTSANMRQTTRNYNLMGYHIPAGVDVIFNHEKMSLSEEYFIRAKEYIPERWLVKKDNPLYYRNAHPFASMPFGFGVRSCIGRRLFELELETLIIGMMKNFKIEWSGTPLKSELCVTYHAKPPFNFIFKDI